MARAYTIALVLTWALSIVDGTIPSFWLFVHPFHRWWRARSAAGLKALALVWVALWGGAAALTWPLLFRTFYDHGWTWLLGAVFWLAGCTVYGKAMGAFSLDQLFGVPEFRPNREQRLVTTGIRSRLRHPVYAGHCLLLAGNSLASGLVANYLLLGWFLVTLPFMLHFEDKELEKRFGDAYRDYKQRVPAIIPWLKSDV
jgi:protein-S-isoprenylcysteine O-methyltransferase Ste14